jgi:hypothetical protein
MTKSERWLNLIAFLLNRHTAVAREELLSQVADYSADWNSGSDTRRESVRRKFERDKSELRHRRRAKAVEGGQGRSPPSTALARPCF